MDPEAGVPGNNIPKSQALLARAGNQSHIAGHFKGGSGDDVDMSFSHPKVCPVGGRCPPRWGKGNTCKILFLKMKMTSKFFLIVEAICLLIKHNPERN